ncbi:unnamed protein product [Urochloa humidicola]
MVTVSQRFTVDDLLRKILKELRPGGAGTSARAEDDDVGAAAGYRSLVAAVRGHLGARRYLVVLDDVWEAHLWDKLRHAFPDDATGSRVVVTTRSEDVAKAAAPARTMVLEPLPRREAWTLFCNVAFREMSGRTCPSHLQEIAADMLERCRGLPLAIVSVGNLLALKDTTEFAWRNVRDGLVWDDSSDDLGVGEAASILNLSIDDLPRHLKKCFLSCSVYPEDLWIKRKILIRKWVAQGFVEDKPGQCTAEDVADGYLDQLIKRCLMQPVTRNEFGRAKRCVIHDLIRELIIHRSRQEEGFMLFAKCKVTVDPSVRIRHLAVDRCEEMDSQDVPQLATLRSFNAFGSELGASFLSHFRLLTVLNLWYVEMNKLPSSVTSLHNLRYLGVRGTLIQELPKELGKLHKLQILDAKLSMVQRLPSSVSNLKSLRHLIVLTRGSTDLLKPYPATATEVPQGLEKLTSLQTLKYVQANKKMVTSLAKLGQMRSLELCGIDTSLIVDLSASISRVSFLRRLGVEINPGEDTVLDLESISGPPLKLQKLSLTGRLARGKLPSWICSLTSLIHLRLHGCQIAQDSLEILAALPGLVNLSLISAYRERSMIFTQDSFPALRKLTLESLPDLSHIAFQEGSLANLCDLVLGQCTELTETPQGMENLKHIKNLELFGMQTEFVDKLKEQNGNAAYHNPASSDFYQAPKVLRFVKFVKK